jgi:hypothetical protein
MTRSPLVRESARLGVGGDDEQSLVVLLVVEDGEMLGKLVGAECITSGFTSNRPDAGQPCWHR